MTLGGQAQFMEQRIPQSVPCNATPAPPIDAYPAPMTPNLPMS